jgi:hypothetical protein
MYVIIGSHFVPLEGKFSLIALVIVRITLNVTVCQMPLNAKQRCALFKKLLSNFRTLRQHFRRGENIIVKVFESYPYNN